MYFVTLHLVWQWNVLTSYSGGVTGKGHILFFSLCPVGGAIGPGNPFPGENRYVTHTHTYTRTHTHTHTLAVKMARYRESAVPRPERWMALVVVVGAGWCAHGSSPPSLSPSLPPSLALSRLNHTEEHAIGRRLAATAPGVSSNIPQNLHSTQMHHGIEGEHGWGKGFGRCVCVWGGTRVWFREWVWGVI